MISAFRRIFCRARTETSGADTGIESPANADTRNNSAGRSVDQVAPELPVQNPRIDSSREDPDEIRSIPETPVRGNPFRRSPFRGTLVRSSELSPVSARCRIPLRDQPMIPGNWLESLWAGLGASSDSGTEDLSEDAYVSMDDLSEIPEDGGIVDQFTDEFFSTATPANVPPVGLPYAGNSQILTRQDRVFNQTLWETPTTRFPGNYRRSIRGMATPHPHPVTANVVVVDPSETLV